MVAESTDILAPMSQLGWATGLFRRGLGHGLHRRLAERPARGGKHDLLDALAALEVEHLVDGVVLRIDRKQRRPAALDLGQHERAGADQALLVGEADDGALRGCCERRPEPGCADDAGHDEIGGRGGGFDQGLRAGGCGRLGPGERLLEGAVERGIADDGLLGADRTGLFGEALDAALGGQRLDLERARVARDQVDGVAADRAGGAQDRDAPGRRPLSGGEEIRLRPDVDDRVHRRHSRSSFVSRALGVVWGISFQPSPATATAKAGGLARDPRRRRTI